MDEEPIVQNMKLVVLDTQNVPLSHLVTPPLPTQPLIIIRIVLCPDEDGLPVVVRLVPLPNVEHPHARRVGHGHPLLRLGNSMTVHAHILVEGDGSLVREHVDQVTLVLREGRHVRLHLKDGEDKYLLVWPLEIGVVEADHFYEVRN